jgi:hypothetical protein
MPIQNLLSLPRKDSKLEQVLRASEIGRFKGLVCECKSKESHLRAEQKAWARLVYREYRKCFYGALEPFLAGAGLSDHRPYDLRFFVTKVGLGLLELRLDYKPWLSVH